MLTDMREDSEIRISVIELAEQRVLAGAGTGKALLSKLAAIPLSASGVVYLDFEGIEIATASFLRDGVVAYRDFVRSAYPSRYAVIANPSDQILEELEFFLSQRRDAMWVCILNSEGRATKARIAGDLDEIQRSTLKSVFELGIASAPELAILNQTDAAIGATAWNNRLQSLASKGLLMENRAGKSKQFRPVLEVSRGG